jgi:hypothetical protein
MSIDLLSFDYTLLFYLNINFCLVGHNYIHRTTTSSSTISVSASSACRTTSSKISCLTPLDVFQSYANFLVPCKRTDGLTLYRPDNLLLAWL